MAGPDDAVVHYGHLVLSDDLLELQRLDTLTDQLRHRRAHLPERVAADAASTVVADLDRRAAALARRDGELVDAIAGLEHDSDELTRHRARLEAQLKTVIAPREAEALMHEIETIKTKRDALDERELEHLQEQSDIADEQTAIAADRPDRQRLADETAAVLAGAEADLATEASETAAARTELLGRIDAAALAEYDRRRQHFGGVAIARLDVRRCTGCHLDLAPAEVDQVRATPAGEWTDCPECGRMLVP